MGFRIWLLSFDEGSSRSISSTKFRLWHSIRKPLSFSIAILISRILAVLLTFVNVKSLKVLTMVFLALPSSLV